MRRAPHHTTVLVPPRRAQPVARHPGLRAEPPPGPARGCGSGGGTGRGRISTMGGRLTLADRGKVVGVVAVLVAAIPCSPPQRWAMS